MRRKQRKLGGLSEEVKTSTTQTIYEILMWQTLWIYFAFTVIGRCVTHRAASHCNQIASDKREMESHFGLPDGFGLSSFLLPLRADQFLRLDRHFGQSLNTRPVFTQSVLHDAKIETWNDDIVPAVADSAQRHIEHGDDLIPNGSWLSSVMAPKNSWHSV